VKIQIDPEMEESTKDAEPGLLSVLNAIEIFLEGEL
jgi:hypothetical protein